MKIEIVQASDAASLLDIYKPYITGTVVTFENEVPGIPGFEARIQKVLETYPWLVSKDEEGHILGYAYATAYRERAAYQWVCEVSVYVNSQFRKTGVATILYSALMRILQEQGIYKAYAIITVPNAESVGFHEKFGFTYFATYQNVGFKNNQWLDVGWWEYAIQLPGTPSQDIIPFSQLKSATVAALLNIKPD